MACPACAAKKEEVSCTEEEGKDFSLLVAAAFLWLTGVLGKPLLSQTPYALAEHFVFIMAYILSGFRVLRRAWDNLRCGRIWDEHLLMSLSSLGAVAIGQLAEAAAVMLLFTTGEYLQERAVRNCRRSIASLVELRADYAEVISGEETKSVPPEEVEVGQLILVKPGQKVPLDGEVVEGASSMDTKALTGESRPRLVGEGDHVLAGMVNGEGLLVLKVTRPFRESSVARILKLVQEAAERKAPVEKFITAFSRYYTPVVVLGALAVALVPPLIFPQARLGDWVYRALVLLVISFPCALVVSVPLTYFSGLGGASRQGILVKGANYLEALALLHTVIFDKTGTLTRGTLKVSRVIPCNGFTEEEVLRAAAGAEGYSTHPLARTIYQAYRQTYGAKHPALEVKDFKELPGYGITAIVERKRVWAGSDRLLHLKGIPHDTCDPAGGTAVHVVLDGVYAGYVVIEDEIKSDAHEAVARLRQLGVKRMVLLTGDREPVARQVARSLGLDAYFAELLPEGKVKVMEELQASLPQGAKGKIAFVGDGLNDAPVIMRADVGVAMGKLGSDAALEAADVVLMEDRLSKLATAIKIARRTRRIVKQNMILALGIKGIFFLLGVLGLATIGEAVFADVGVTLLAVINAGRAFKVQG